MKKEIDSLILQGFLQQLLSAEAIEHVASVCEQACRLCGCELVQYGVLVPVSPSRPPRLVTFGNWSDELRTYYFNQDFVNLDPVVASILDGRPTLTWNELDYASTPQRRMLRSDLLDLGMCDGAACGTVGRFGEAACLSFASGGDMNRIGAELQHHLPLMHLLFAHVHQTVLRIEGVATPALAPLTARELECLRWAAEGKTSAETAQLLKVSEHTVIRHIANASGKLGAANRTHAVAKAILMGLFQP